MDPQTSGQSIKIVETQGKRFKPMISLAEIQAQTRRVAQEISKDYKGKNPIFIGILNGAFIWLSDLLRELDFLDLTIDFCKVITNTNKKKISFTS